jgi:hypothetical protein
MPGTDGPFLNAAILCERVLTEVDGARSVIRIVDRIVVGAMPASAGGAVPRDMPTTAVQLTTLIRLISGAARGRATLRLALQNPSGMLEAPMDMPVQFEGEDRAVVLTVNLALTLQLEGLYQVVVSLDDELLSKIPLRVVYQPSPAAPAI